MNITKTGLIAATAAGTLMFAPVTANAAPETPQISITAHHGCIPNCPTPKVKAKMTRKAMKGRTKKLTVTITAKGVSFKVNKYGNLIAYRGKKAIDGLGRGLPMYRGKNIEGAVYGSWKVNGHNITFTAKRRDLSSQGRFQRGCNARQGNKIMVGAFVGGAGAGFMAGLLGGPFAEVTVPVAALSGGSSAGFFAGTGYWLTCWW